MAKKDARVAYIAKSTNFAKPILNHELGLLGFGFSFFDFLDVFSRLFVEVFQTTFATELDFPTFVGKHVWLAHLPEFFAGNDASFEGIGLVFRVRGKADQRRSEKRDCKSGNSEVFNDFHIVLCIRH